MAGNSQNQLLDNLVKLRISGDFSDLTITCGSDEYKVHKGIVCSRADFFKRTIEFGGVESETSKIDLPEDEPAIVKLLMQYIYEAEYEPTLPDKEVWSISHVTSSVEAHSNPPIHRQKVKTKKKSSTKHFAPHTCPDAFNRICMEDICPHHTCGMDCSSHCNEFVCPICIESSKGASTIVIPVTGEAEQLLIHSKMYSIGDCYDVVGLKDLAREKFRRACAKFWDEPAFAMAAHHVFTTTPDHDKGLRDIVSETIASHLCAMVENPEIEALLTEFNGLAYGLLKKSVKANSI